MEPQPLKTFRTDISLYEQPLEATVPSSKRLSNGATWSHYTTSTSLDVTDTCSSPKVKSSRDERISEKLIIDSSMGNGASSPAMNGGHNAETIRFGEARSLRREHGMDEAVRTGRLDLLSMKGIVHPQTDEILSVEDAIRLRILDTRTGKIAVDPTSKSTYIGIEEAVQRKLVLPELAERLLGPCGTIQDGKDRTSPLVEAVRLPIERLKANSVYETCSIAPGDEFGEKTLSKANLPLALFDLLCSDLVDRETGLIFDRDTGKYCDFEEAIKKRILDPHVREIVDAAADDKVTLRDALDDALIKNGKYFHRLSEERITFDEAKRRRLVIPPLSLKDCVDLEVLGENGLLKSPTYRADLKLSDAIKRAVVDADANKTVLNRASGQLVTLANAIRDGVITSDSYYVDKLNNQIVPIQRAVELGWLCSTSIKSVFDLGAFETEANGKYVSYNEAVRDGLLKIDNEFVYYRCPTGDWVPINEAGGKGYVRTNVLDMLNREIGISINAKELTVLEATMRGRINSRTGLLIDSVSGADVPFCEAVERNLITSDGVLLLKSLLAITLSTQTITKTVVTYSNTVQFPLERRQEIIIPNRDTDDAESSKKSKSPIKQKIIKMLGTLQMKKDEGSTNVPPEGWDLQTAIAKNLFDPVTGLFIIPGTDRQVSFEECIQLRLINSDSAMVVVPRKNKRVSLKRSLEKRILDCTGHYRASANEEMTMKEAIEKSFVLFLNENTENEKPTSPSTETNGVNLEPIRITSNVIFDPETALVIFLESNSSDEICHAVQAKKITPTEIKIKISPDGVESDLATAIREQRIDLHDRAYVNENGSKIAFNEAIKKGLVRVLGCPLVATKTLTDEERENVSRAIREAQGYGKFLSIDAEKSGPSLAELTRTRVTTEPKYLVSIGKAKSIEQNANAARPVLLQKMRKKRVKPKDAIPSGIIDKNTADLLENLGNLKDSHGNRLNLFEALDLTLTNPNAKLIRDPRTRDMVSIKEAIERGILDHSSSPVKLLVPVARSLSLPNLLKQGLIDNGKIIHPETGNDLSLLEAIACDIADPLSMIKDPSTGKVLTLKDAMDIGIVDGNLEIKAENGGNLNIGTAAKKGNIFLEENESEIRLPPAAMTLTVATEKGLYDTTTRQVRRPLTDEQIPLEKAIEEGLIMTFRDRLQGAEMENELNPKDEILSPDTILYDTASDTAFTLKQGTDVEIIDASSGKLKYRGNEMNIKDAVNLGLLAAIEAPVLATAEILKARRKNTAPKELTPVVKEPKFRIILTKYLTEEELTKRGLYDPKRNVFLDPKTSVELKFSEFILNSDLFQVERIYVRNLLGFDAYMPVYAALALKVLDDEGCIADPITGHKMSFFDSVRLGWITELENVEYEDNVPFSDVLARGILNTNDTGRMDLHSCLKSGLVNAESVLVRTSKSSAPISLSQAIEVGVVDLDAGILHDDEGCEHDLISAFSQGLVFPRRKGMSLVAVVRRGYYDKEQNKIFDDTVNEFVSLQESIARCVVDPSLTECKDVKQDEYVTLADAIENGLIRDCCLINTISNKPIKLDAAVDQHMIIHRPFSIGLVEAVTLKYYEPKTRKIFNTCTGETQTVQQAVDSQFLNVTNIVVKDAKRNEYVPLYRAVHSGIIDLEKGVILTPVEMTLDVGVKKKSLRLQKAADNDKTDFEEWSRIVFKRGNQFFNFEHAVRAGIVDTDRRTVRCDGKVVPLDEAIQSSDLVIEFIRPAPLKEAVDKGLFDERTSLFYDPQANEYATLAEALERQLLCPHSATVKEATDKKLYLAEAIKLGLVDGEKAFVKKVGTANVPLLRAYDEGLITDAVRMMPLQRVLDLGFYDENDGSVVDPNIETKLTLAEAIERRVINAKAACHWDDRTKTLLSLYDCCKYGIVDPLAGMFRSPATGESVNLIDARCRGYIVKIKWMGLHEAASWGYFDRGLFIHPENNRRLTLKQAIADNFIAPDASLVRSAERRTFVQVPRAIELRVIDDINGLYITPGTGEKLTLPDACSRSFIIPNLGKLSSTRSTTTTVGTFTSIIDDKSSSRLFVINKRCTLEKATTEVIDSFTVRNRQYLRSPELRNTQVQSRSMSRDHMVEAGFSRQPAFNDRYSEKENTRSRSLDNLHSPKPRLKNRLQQTASPLVFRHRQFFEVLKTSTLPPANASSTVVERVLNFILKKAAHENAKIDQYDELRRRVNAFCCNFVRRWNRANRTENKFLAGNKAWLDTIFAVPLLASEYGVAKPPPQETSVPQHHKPNSSTNSDVLRGRPRRLLPNSSFNTKNRMVNDHR